MQTVTQAAKERFQSIKATLVTGSVTIKKRPSRSLDHAKLYGCYLETYLRVQHSKTLPRSSRLVGKKKKTQYEKQVCAVYRFYAESETSRTPTRMFMIVVMYERGIHERGSLRWVDMGEVNVMIRNAQLAISMLGVDCKSLVFEKNIQTPDYTGRADIYDKQTATVIELKHVVSLQPWHFSQVLLYKQALSAKNAYLVNCSEGAVWRVEAEH